MARSLLPRHSSSIIRQDARTCLPFESKQLPFIQSRAFETRRSRHVASHLDEADHRILDTLRNDGRMSMRTLAEPLHISRANAYARVDRLRTTGVIRGFRADIDPVLSGLGTSAYITINLRQPDWHQVLE